MSSLIDPSKPTATAATTASVRANFTAAKNEIEALQATDLLKADLSGAAFSGALTAVDSNFNVLGSSDASKKIKFEVDGLTTATTRTITMPDANVALPPMTLLTNSLGADVNLNNTANYFDGPVVAQGTAGTWFAIGTVTVHDGAASSGFHAKLWDGTTVFASCSTRSQAANGPTIISLSGYIASPAGNIRISVRDITSTGGFLDFNFSGNNKDCTITAIRIA